MRISARICLVAALCAVLSLACVKTEKRTTKKVDTSKLTVYEYDPARPGIRVALDFPGELREILTARLYVEIDDGINRYGLPGNACGPDSAETDDVLYSPWINTPDSGQVSLKFHLADPEEFASVNDSISMDLRPDQHWQVTVGVFDDNRCETAADGSECRSYPLAADLKKKDSQQLFMIWRGNPISQAGSQ